MLKFAVIIALALLSTIARRLMFITHSWVRGEAQLMRGAALLFASCCFAYGAAAEAAKPAAERVCFSAAQTREKIGAHKLAEPFRLMKTAANRFQAEAIGVKLCRWGEEFIYEINLLRRDGHVIHVFVNAGNGQVVGSKNTR
ncbi:MAG: PepSY domain-containing protein [Beijerinckiaceae bacterium]